MAEIIETSGKFIFVCNNKNESLFISRLLDKKFPNSEYANRAYLRSPAIFLNKDSQILSEINSDIEMEQFLAQNL